MALVADGGVRVRQLDLMGVLPVSPYILIGGQAVNYWAERYLTTEPELEGLKPFTSADIDFKGTQADVERIARQLSLNAKIGRAHV